MNMGEIEQLFSELLELTRDFLEGQAEDPIPPVDLHEILPDFWGEWFNPLLEAWTPQVRHDLRVFFLDQMKRHSGDVEVRYTALAIYDGLIQYLTGLPMFHEPQAPAIGPFSVGDKAPSTARPKRPGGLVVTSWGQHVPIFKEDLRSVLHFVNIPDIADWRNIRWEISNSSLIEDWDRAFRLYDMARELRMVNKHDVHLLLGQFQFLLAFRNTPTAHLQADILQDNSPFLRKQDFALHPANWEAQRYDSSDSLSSLLFFASGLAVSSEDAEAHALDRQSLNDAVDGLEKVRQFGQLTPPYKAALARCYFAAGRFDEAASQYEWLLKEDLEGLWHQLASPVYSAVATSYICAKAPSKAIATLQACSMKFPMETDVYMKTAELQAQETDYIGVRDTIRTAADLTGLDKDWRLSSLLALGAIRAAPGAILEATIVDPRLDDGISAVLRDYWPPFEKICDKAKEEWVKGSYLRSFPEKGMAATFSLEALLGLIKALDAELAQKVFDPAREHFRTDKQLDGLVRGELTRDPDGEQAVFCKFVSHPRRNLGIGQKSKILFTCQHRRTEVFAALLGWLDQHFPALLAQTKQLERVSRFRNVAEHEGRQTETSDYIFNACRDLIESLQ